MAINPGIILGALTLGGLALSMLGRAEASDEEQALLDARADELEREAAIDEGIWKEWEIARSQGNTDAQARIQEELDRLAGAKERSQALFDANQKEARDQAVLDQAVRDQAVLDQAVLDQAVRDQEARDQAVLDAQQLFHDDLTIARSMYGAYYNFTAETPGELLAEISLAEAAMALALAPPTTQSNYDVLLAKLENRFPDYDFLATTVEGLQTEGDLAFAEEEAESAFQTLRAFAEGTYKDYDFRTAETIEELEVLIDAAFNDVIAKQALFILEQSGKTDDDDEEEVLPFISWDPIFTEPVPIITEPVEQFIGGQAPAPVYWDPIFTEPVPIITEPVEQFISTYDVSPVEEFIRTYDVPPVIPIADEWSYQYEVDVPVVEEYVAFDAPVVEEYVAFDAPVETIITGGWPVQPAFTGDYAATRQAAPPAFTGDYWETARPVRTAPRGFAAPVPRIGLTI